MRKIERQYVELSGEKMKPLKVQDRSVEATVQKFQWDFATFPTQGKQLSELVSSVQGIAGKADEELKALAATYADKNLAYATAQRRKVVNFATSDFEDFLKPEEVARLDLMSTESLLTVLVVVPKAIEEEFLRTYHTLGSDIAAFGGPDWSASEAVGSADGRFGTKVDRGKVRGSPVVPKSKKLVKEEGDTALYAITVLRGHYSAGQYVDDVFVPGTFVDYVEPLKTACREKRIVLREFSYDSTKAGGVDGAIRAAKEESSSAKSTLLQWCRAHFGEVFSAWLHLKVLTAYAESVLRYGVPADFVSLFVQVDSRHEKDLRDSLSRTILSLRPELRPRKALVEDEDEDAEADSLPYVLVKFSLVGAQTASSS